MSWIKVEKCLHEKPEVIAIASSLGITENEVVGALIKVWSWADTHLENGNARSVTLAFLDRCSGVTGFGELMRREGWIEEVSGGLRFPNFDRHMAQTAKKRALTAARVARHRNAPVTPEALPEKRREEEIREEDKEMARAAREILDFFSSDSRMKTFRKWSQSRLQAFRARWKDPDWRSNYETALASLAASPFWQSRGGADIDFFLRPDSVLKTVEGKYDQDYAKRNGSQAPLLKLGDGDVDAK